MLGRVWWLAPLALPAHAGPTLFGWVQACYQLGLITNGRSKGQRRKIAAAGIAGFFRAILVSEESGTAKPDPAIFHLVLDELGVAPERSVYIGDHPTNDIEASVAAGMLLERQVTNLPLPFAGLAVLGYEQ